jgi:hypothetical protein
MRRRGLNPNRPRASSHFQAFSQEHSTWYQEAQARHEFIDKFLMALGWDVNHETQKNPYEQEVKVESREPGVSQRPPIMPFISRPISERDTISVKCAA